MSAPDVAAIDCRTSALGPLGSDDSQPDLGDRVLVVVALTPEKAHELAAHCRSQTALKRVTLAEQNRDIGDPVMRLLVEKGYGK